MLAILTFAASLAIQAPAEKPTTRAVHPFEIGAEYHRVRDYTTLSLLLPDVLVVEGRDVDDPGLIVKAQVYATWDGEARKAIDPLQAIRIQFATISKTWEFRDSHEIVLLYDATRFRDAGERKEDPRKGYVVESIACKMGFAQLKDVAAAESVEVALGNHEFRLTAQHLAGLKDLVARLSASSEEADRIGADHLLLVRQRRQEMQEAADAAAVRCKAKRGRKATFDDFAREFAKTQAEYRPTDAEMTELLQAHPDLAPTADDGRL